MIFIWSNCDFNFSSHELDHFSLFNCYKSGTVALFWCGPWAGNAEYLLGWLFVYKRLTFKNYNWVVLCRFSTLLKWFQHLITIIKASEFWDRTHELVIVNKSTLVNNPQIACTVENAALACEPIYLIIGTLVKFRPPFPMYFFPNGEHLRKSGWQTSEVATGFFKIRTTRWLCRSHKIIFRQDECLIIVKLCLEYTIDLKKVRMANSRNC